MTSSRLTSLRVIVTGGASGIGAAIAKRLVDDGASVVVLDRDIVKIPDGTYGIRADVTDDASVRAAVAEAAARLGGLDTVVANAGIGAAGSVLENSDDEWHAVYDVNVVGIVRVVRAAIPHLIAAETASIVTTCSIAATAGLPQRALYSATKGAVAALTRAMAADHLRDGIRVNCVSPGTADTPWVSRLLEAADDPVVERAALNARQPHGRLVAPEEVAAAVAYLVDPTAASTTGTVLPVDGGMDALRLRPVM